MAGIWPLFYSKMALAQEEAPQEQQVQLIEDPAEAEQLAQAGAPIFPMPEEPRSMARDSGNPMSQMPVSMRQRYEDITNQYDVMSKQALSEQDLGINQLQEYAKNYSKQPQSMNWAPLAAWADSMVEGSKLSQGVPQYESPQDRAAKMMQLQNMIQQRRESVTKNKLDALGQQLKAYGTLMKPDLSGPSADKLKAQTDWYRSQSGKIPQQQEKDAQKIRQDFIKTKESQGVQALIKLQDSVDKYRGLVNKHGTQLVGEGRKELETAFADLKIKYKEAANLGALTGPDIGVLEEAIAPSTGVVGSVKAQLVGGVPGIISGLDEIKQIIQKDAGTTMSVLKEAFPSGAESLIKNYEDKLFKSNDRQKRLDELIKKAGK